MIAVEDTTIEVVGPTPEAIDVLRADFAASAVEWQCKARNAALEGRYERAQTYLAVADLAARVAGGRIS